MLQTILKELQSKADAGYKQKMARYAIDTKKMMGVRLPLIRELAKSYKKQHQVALELWESEIHEARLLATMIADAKEMTETEMDSWVQDFYSWDICDQACSNVFIKHELSLTKIFDWLKSDEEFIKRAGFVMIAMAAVHLKKKENAYFYPFFPILEANADDARNFVKKAVNWALRQIGKRNLHLNKKAIDSAERILKQNSNSAKWIASNALAELKNEKLHVKLKGKE